MAAPMGIDTIDKDLDQHLETSTLVRHEFLKASVVASVMNELTTSGLKDLPDQTVEGLVVHLFTKISLGPQSNVPHARFRSRALI